MINRDNLIAVTVDLKGVFAVMETTDQTLIDQNIKLVNELFTDTFNSVLRIEEFAFEKSPYRKGFRFRASHYLCSGNV